MTTSVQIDQELEHRIRRLAELSQMSPDQVVRDAVTQYADRMNARQDFLREADESWEAYQRDGLHLTGDEGSAWLKTVGTDDAVEMPECHK